jgi:hypothetical protein
VPRVGKQERRARDALALSLFLAGESYRDIGRHPDVGLSCRGTELAVRRRLADQGVDKEDVEELFATAYIRAQRGDVRAKEQVRRLMALLLREGAMLSAAERHAHPGRRRRAALAGRARVVGPRLT